MMRTPPWAVLLWLLCTGCVALAPQHAGNTAEDSRALPMFRDTTASTPPIEAPFPLASTKPGEQERLHRRRSARGLAPNTALASASVGPAPQGPPSCGGRTVPPGWPDFSSNNSEALLAPFLTCTSPGEVLALQERVDMPRLVEALDDWPAVRLGALGPPREDVAHLLNKKRTSLLVNAREAYGILNAAVLAVFIVDSAYDDDLREILFLLAQDKQLEETLALLPAFQVALERRGLKPTARVDRDFEPRDVVRGGGRFIKDALSSTPMNDGGSGFAFLPIRRQLPPEYQEALARAEKQWVQHTSADTMALSAFDHLTFGVPLGFYGLLATTVHGSQSLVQGKYEEATRELAPAALLVALYTGGKGLRYLSEGSGATGVRLHLLTGLETMEVRLRALKNAARQWEGRLNPEGLQALLREIRASREAGRMVAAGGADAALALYEARGDMARAQPLMSRARPGTTGSPSVKNGTRAGSGEAAAVADETSRPSPNVARNLERRSTLSSLVDDEAGHTLEVVEAKLAAVELETTGPRLPKNVSVLEKHRPSLDAPPPEAGGNPRWREYVNYYEKRFREVKESTAAEGPLKWEPYERMRTWFARGIAFERDMVKLLKEDAKKPRAERHFLGDFDRPRIETQVGVRKPGDGPRYADVLIIEESESVRLPRRIETFSFKSRDLSGLNREAVTAQMKVDARDALRNYGGMLDIRRDSLQSLLPGGSDVRVSRVCLIYEGGKLAPRDVDASRAAAIATEKAVPGVEVLFQ